MSFWKSSCSCSVENYLYPQFTYKQKKCAHQRVMCMQYSAIVGINWQNFTVPSTMHCTFLIILINLDQSLACKSIVVEPLSYIIVPLLILSERYRYLYGIYGIRDILSASKSYIQTMEHNYENITNFVESSMFSKYFNRNSLIDRIESNISISANWIIAFLPQLRGLIWWNGSSHQDYNGIYPIQTLAAVTCSTLTARCLCMKCCV